VTIFLTIFVQITDNEDTMEAAEIAAAQDDGSAEEENATGTEAEADEAEVADLDIEMEEEDALMDTYEDCFKPADTTHYLTMEEMHEMKTVDKRVKVPPLSKWKELASTQKIHITVAKARRRLWKQAKDEVEVFRKNVKDLRLGTSAPNQVEGDDLQRVYHYLFGATSKLADIFLRNIDGLSKQDYLSFMLTYFMSCKYGHAVATLHNAPDEEFNSGALMPTAQYNGIWRKIAKLRATNREEAFWQELETTMNFLCRKLFMASKEDFPLFHYRIGLDDDKPHYAWTKHSDATAIKKVHHAKDNRRGFTVHTAAYSATDVPVGVVFQREKESVQDSFLRIVGDLFGKSTGNATDLHGATFASDRGYWIASLLFKLLDAGAEIEGTIKRVSRPPSCLQDACTI
jgi:hypothetical protein